MKENDEIIVEEWVKARKLIDTKLQPVITEIGDAATQEILAYIAEGGKRFRGFLTLTMAQALGGTIEEAIDAAISIELVHSASLALDDMADMDTIRRGKPSAWIAYSTSKTALASLLLIAVAQRRVERYGFEAIKRVIRAWEDTVKGEILDAFKYNTLDKTSYIKIIELKTASLFRLASELGALASPSKTQYLENASRYGTLLGIIYQITDDMVDYIQHTKTGRQLDPTEQLYYQWINPTDGDLIIKTKNILEKLIQDAKKEIQNLENTKHKEILLQLPEFISRKMIEESGINKHATLP